MNLQQLEYFKTVAETENFTKASKLLLVTQPALSKSIAKLEGELKVPLFEKSGRNVKLTRFGKLFLVHAERALVEIEKGIKELDEMVSDTTGTVSISSTSRVGAYFMNFIISDFLNDNPNVKFQFNQQSVTEIIEDLKKGKIDIGFYDNHTEPIWDINIESIPIKKQEYILIVPKNHKLAGRGEVSLKELENESFIAFCEGSKDRILSCTDALGYTPKISIQPKGANIGSVIEGLVSAGAGISVVPDSPTINTNTLSKINIKETIKERIIYMSYLKNSYIPPIAKLFRDYILEYVDRNYITSS
ncbi:MULTISPECIES: LysR family transcriptional regulator [Romboutsia]|uniref:HTH-type transcriptional regulator GltC n=1 Tax=Romboutsia hominis TaxID=1507512 RepID=A0A2P2BN84_9FIRM|nr:MULTISPECIES: LysR family transcriptional regulator [Romboutsia]MCH1958481.1 LysR family transcriptional regulator [Romboutsia hominis]MCH1970396.1 LysR family transcriptional regulator [Romboutsia hominis]MDB8790015.1 LysR family transcriptional regulator [Romboutsia sp. 1001216sp1]MDB8793086.1 LysR family transcriptional regulator [Romboutsia sp. 1001216sp1]MDB8795879.1 LysR family transcriptional regulator [Romboutsia sp. 1001216sp1]